MNEKNIIVEVLYLGIAFVLGTLFIKVVESLMVTFGCFAYILVYSPKIYLKSQCELKRCSADSCFVCVEEVKRCLDKNLNNQRVFL